ncbi:MAG: hypothetical protein JKX84_09990, partial [Flavobacteriales bacterium]|nr:hypothetical protein [Flavobacteriales bacterium]
MKKSVLIVLSSLFFLSTQVRAQFTLDAELRPRAEYAHGQKALSEIGQEPAFYTLQRTRLNTGYKSKWIDLYISLQDIRVWGNKPQLVLNDGESTTLHQAYAVAKAAKWLDIKVGRQEIILDDHRIFGNVGWAQQARSHDAIIFKIKPDSKTKIWMAGAYNQDKPQTRTNLYTVPKNYKTMQFLWMNRDFGKFKASALFLNNGLQVNKSDSLSFLGADTVTTRIGYAERGTYFSQTIGARVGYYGKKFKAIGAFYYQLGLNGTFTIDSSGTASSGEFGISKTKLNAMLARLDLEYKVGSFILSGGYEYTSGNNMVNTDGTDQAFNPFFGTNHKFNGLMDYFYVGNYYKNAGLNDIFLGVKYKKKKFWTGVTAHHFMT